MGYEKPPPKLTFYKAFFLAQWKFLIHTIVQCIHAKRNAWNEFSSSMALAVICLDTGRKFNFSKYIFDNMVRNVDSPSKFLMYPWFLQVMINAQVDDLSSYNTKYTSPALTQKVFVNMRRTGKVFSGVETPLFDTMLVQPQVQDAVEVDVEDEDDNERVGKLKKKRRSKSSGLKRLRKVGTSQRVKSSNDNIMDNQEAASKQEGKIAKLDADEDVILIDVDTAVEMDADTQGRMEEDVTAIKDIKAAESKPTMAKRLQDEEIEQAAVREKHEKEDLERAKMQEKHLDNIKKYQILKRKPISVAQARKNMVVYLKNMAGYKIQHFKGMTYNQVRPIFKREYNKVQTFLESDRDEEPTKKRAAKETLLQESFKKLKAEVKVLEKDYPLTDVVLLLMLSVKLQVDEDYEMARDLVMKIFMKANKPKSKRKENDVAAESDQEITLNLLKSKDPQVAWSSNKKFYRHILRYFLHGRVPAERLIPDEIEAGSGWWVSSRAYFDGRVNEAK
nr:hypothetical protein [Tanacetum cinerariifolium]